jgi:cation transport ATPase
MRVFKNYESDWLKDKQQGVMAEGDDQFKRQSMVSEAKDLEANKAEEHFSQTEYVQNKINYQQAMTDKRKQKSFECFPRHMKKYKAKNAKKLRHQLAWMLTFHIVFIMMEVFLYEFVFMVLALELFYMWLCYQCYMTLSSPCTYAYIFFMGLAPILGIRSLVEVGIRDEHHYSFFKSFVFTIQLGIYAYYGVYKLIIALRIWIKAKAENEKSLFIKK